MMQILTKDSVTVFVNAIMYYKVKVSKQNSSFFNKHSKHKSLKQEFRNSEILAMSGVRCKYMDK